ncbi:MAG: serine/threonine protein phosphatase [Ruminococcus sp.]|nr:serine/threonine protein phosphatase [Ruminococcus sp.]
MKLFSKKKGTQQSAVQTCAVHNKGVHPFSVLSRYSPQSMVELELYSSLREAVPMIDAAIGKIVRLLGGFCVEATEAQYQKELDMFVQQVPTGGGGTGLEGFVYSYFDQLLTFGTAVGEMIPRGDLGGIGALYNASLRDVTVTEGETPLDIIVSRRDSSHTPLERQDLVFATLLSPTPGRVQGNSLLKGLPFISSVLLRIFGAIGNNWERAGNIRYAVTYNPPEGGGTNARQRAREIADEWSRAMRDESRVCDFVSVGDVSIRVIGADSQILDCDVPIKHVTEQIVSKLGIPPFLLGLSWSSTERMSSVQADILTSELEYYRSLLTPVIRKICLAHLRLLGSFGDVRVNWDNISLQDEVQLAQARLDNARAQQIENTLEVTV